MLPSKTVILDAKGTMQDQLSTLSLVRCKVERPAERHQSQVFSSGGGKGASWEP